MTTLSGLLSAELAATCNSLGYLDGEKYHLEPHCKETIKDLIRYLRRDEPTHDIRRYLGNAKLLQTDILPILQCHHQDTDLFDVILRLMVNLTNPALLLYNEVIPADKNEHNQYLEVVSHLQNYKEAFCNQKLWVPLSEKLGSLLKKNPEDRDEDDDRTIERILILIRNVLHVPANSTSEWRPDNDASIHDQIIWAFHQSGLMDLLMYITSSTNESNFSLHLLEIICLMLREQPPALLAKTASQRSVEEKNQDDEELLRIRKTESLARQQKVKKFLGTRHSNFGGTFVMKNMKSISDREMIYHKPMRDENDISLLDKDKKKTRIPKNRCPLKCESVERRSAFSIRLILKQFCVEILNAAYNPLMKLVKELLVRGKSQDNDESYYFTAIKFFMEFNRNYKFQVKYVSETLSVETFHFVQKYLDNWFELMVIDKKKLALWSSRMHIALKAYKELLQNLTLMDVSQDNGVRESSKVIKSNIFYVIEYREMLLTLINTFDQAKFSREYLKDLMETLHIFLKLLSAFTKSRKVIVQKPVRKRISKKSKKMNNIPQQVNVEDKWKDISERLQTVLVSPVNIEVIPFDPASDTPMDEQKVEAVKKVHILLKADKLEEAVAHLRASREVWPENDTFGATTISPEEEIEWFKEVYMADLKLNSKPTTNIEENEEIAEVEEEYSDEEEGGHYQSYAEQNFEIMDLVKRFASPKVVAICVSLLNTFDTNSEITNHCVAKMLHRIAWDCKLPAMLYQASLFCKFQKILSSNDSKYKELSSLAIYIIRKFTEVAKTNKKIFAELLFYKSAKDAFEIENGYGSYVEERVKSKMFSSKVFWEEHEEEELKRLHEEFMRTKPSDDAVDWIMDNLINKERSRRGVMKKMKELNLIVENPKRGRKHLSKFTESQETELCTLFQEFRESDDPVKKIMEKLSFSMSRSQIKNTLLRLKMVEDKKELRKKRKSSKTKNNNSRKNKENEENENGSDTSSESDTDEENTTIPEPTPISLPVALVHLAEAMHTYSYLLEGLKWIKASMQECLEDLDDEPSDVPLLPLSSDSIKSIDNNIFQQFLKSLDVVSPQKQEIYWRLPAGWKEIDILNRISLLEIMISHDNDELHTYSEELNLPLRKITGEYCDIVNVMEEVEKNNDSTVEIINPSSSVVARDESVQDNFNKIIADHCRRALDNENIFSQSSQNSLININNPQLEEGTDLRQSYKYTTTNETRLESDDDNDENLISNKPRHFSRRVISAESSDEEIELVTSSTSPTTRRIDSDGDSEEGNCVKRKVKRLAFESDEEEQDRIVAKDDENIKNSENNESHTKRLRNDSDEENQPALKSKCKKRIVIESDEE